MATIKIVFSVRVAWWVRPYLFFVGVMCRLLNSEPNWEKLAYWVDKGVTIKAGDKVAKN